MLKFALWLMKTALAAAVAALVSTIVSWAVVNAYVQEVLSRYGAGTAGPIGVADALSAFGGWSAGGPAASGPERSGASRAAEPAGQEGPAGRSDTAVSEAEGSGAPAEAESAPEARPLGDNTGDPPPQDALAVMGRAAESAEQFYLSAEQLEAVKENISGEARMEIFALILSKVPAEEIRTISELLEDGLHAEEAEAARFILEQYLTQEELYRLFELLQ